jgi:hypothetical protein
MRWRRLGIGLMVALLLHVVVAAILVLAWRQLAPLNPAGPVIVELAPPADRPSAQSVEPTFATIAADAGRSDAAARDDVDRPFADLAAKGEPAAGASEPTLAARSGEGTAPAQHEGENPKDANNTSGEAELHPAPGAQMGAPIDSRIPPVLRPAKKAPRTLAHTSPPQAPARRLSALPGPIVINAIGARVEDRVRAAIARANASGDGVRNAVGNTIATKAANAAAGSAESVVVNAIGMGVHVQPGVPPPPSGAIGTGVAPPSGGRGAAARVNDGALNGTGMGHVASRAGAIGGAAKNLSGALNGSDFRPRRP